jgi:hypothetical protein
MDFKYKLIAIAVLALLSGTAFAAPMLVLPLDVKPYPHVPEGPKADFSVDVVYADFKVLTWEQNRTETRIMTNYTTGQVSRYNFTITAQFTNVSYLAVANITNLSDLDAKMFETCFAAAQKISILQTALGGESFDKGYKSDPGTNFGGVVDGVWLDEKYVGTTWIPSKDYPLNVFQVMDPQHKVQSNIPELSENPEEDGTWIQGVPIAEYYDHTKMTATQMYINGAWVDVTGRVQAGNPKPMVLASNTLVNLVLTSGTPVYSNQGNASVGPVTGMPDWKSYNSNGPALRWTRGGGFDKTWQPHQSKLIAFKGTETMISNNESGINKVLASMENGTMDLYGSITTYLNNMPVNGTYTNTVSTATWLQTVPLQKTAEGYIYNTILEPNQTFQFSQNLVEVYIKEGNPP